MENEQTLLIYYPVEAYTMTNIGLTLTQLLLVYIKSLIVTKLAYCHLEKR